MTAQPDAPTAVPTRVYCSYCFSLGYVVAELYDPLKKNALVGVTSITCPRCRGRKV